MKIAIFSDCYLDLTGGIVTSINSQKSALEHLGHQVNIFSSGYPKTSQELKKLAKRNIFQVPSCKLFFRGFTPVARRPKIIERWLLKEHPELKDFDIFYIHYEAGCSIAGIRLGKKLNIPTVQVMHGREDMGEESIIPFGFRTIVAAFLNLFHSWYLPHKKIVHRDEYLADTLAKAKMWTLMVNHANSADYLVVPSKHFAKKLEHYGAKKADLIFPNGYLDEKFPVHPPVKDLKPGETLRMIWHSRVSGEKRIMPFLEALKGVTGNYFLDVYGGGPELKRAEKYASKNKLNVTFHGDTSYVKIQDAIINSHLDVLVSYNFDDYPTILVEAEAAGVPVFICDPDMEEIIPAGGYVLSGNETPEKMTKALNDLISHPERIRSMSETMLKNRKEVLISKRIKIILDFFSSITDKKLT